MADKQFLEVNALGETVRAYGVMTTRTTASLAALDSAVLAAPEVLSYAGLDGRFISNSETLPRQPTALEKSTIPRDRPLSGIYRPGGAGQRVEYNFATSTWVNAGLASSAAALASVMKTVIIDGDSITAEFLTPSVPDALGLTVTGVATTASNSGLASAGLLTKFQSATTAVPPTPTTQELTDYGVIAGYRTLASGAQQPVTWSRPTSVWQDSGVARAVQPSVDAVKSAIGNNRTGLATKVQADGIQFADGYAWLPVVTGTLVANFGTMVAGGDCMYVRQYAGPVMLSWFLTGQNATVALQAAINAATARTNYARKVLIDPPVAFPYYIISDTIILAPGTSLEYTGSTIRPLTGEDADGALFLFSPGTLSTKALFKFPAVQTAGSAGYSEPTTLRNITAQLQVASRGGGASFIECATPSKLVVQGGYIDRFDNPVRGNVFIDTEFRGVTFITFRTAIKLTGVDSTTTTFYKCYFKGNSESDLIFDLAADAVVNMECYSCIFESAKQIAKVQRGSNLELHGCYSENIGYDGGILPAFEVAKTGTSAKAAQAHGSLKIVGGLMHGVNGAAVNDNSTFIDTDDAHQIVVIGMELARFARALVTTTLTGHINWTGNTFIQTGTTAQPDAWRGVARWDRFMGERTVNRVIGFQPPALIASGLRLQSLGQIGARREWYAYAQFENTDADYCLDFNGARKLRVDANGDMWSTGGLRTDYGVAPGLVTRALLLSLSGVRVVGIWQLSDPAAGKSPLAVRVGTTWVYANDGSLVT